MCFVCVCLYAFSFLLVSILMLNLDGFGAPFGLFGVPEGLRRSLGALRGPLGR